MNATLSRLVFGVVLATGAVTVPAKESLRCGNELATLGDGTWQVAKACGEPDYRHHDSEVDVGSAGIIGSVRTWYYNRGPQSFLRVLYFRDGDLERIARAGRGFSRIPDARCTPRVFDRARTKFEIAHVCGEPQYKDTWFRRHNRYGLERVEEWVYDFGPRRFARELRFIDGRLVNVETIDP